MKMLRLMMAAALLAFATLFAIAPAQAQQQVHICMFSVGANGSNNCQDITASFPFPVTASVTISGFAPSASGSVGTPISVTTGGVSGTLPTGAEVIASNAGATNTAYCQLGASATTSSQPIPPNSWFSFTVGSATQLTCVTSASTTTVNMIGGAGLATGAGGGGGSGGGAVTLAAGAVSTGAYSAGALAAGAIADGGDTTQGSKADAKSTATDTTAITLMQVEKEISFQSQAIAASVAGAIPAGSAVIGYTSADPCSQAAKTNVPISTASGTLALVTGVSAKKIYVCSFSIVAAGAISVSLSEGSGTTCGTSAQAGVMGVATNGTAANGMALAANGGLTFGNGAGTIAETATAANYLCLFQSGTTQLAGNLTYVQQ